MSDYEYLIKQLDLLVGVLDVSEQAIFEQIRNHDSFSLGISIGMLYENYSNHIGRLRND